MIEWKSWKDNGDSYCVRFPWEELVGNLWVCCVVSEYTLEEAKQRAQEELEKRVLDCIKLVDI